MLSKTSTAGVRSFSLSAMLLVSLSVCLFLQVPAAHARSVAGVALDDAITMDDQSLTLRGAGIRKKLFIKLYVGSLYLQNGAASAADIVAADEAMAIRLDILSDLLTRKKMLAALEEGFETSTGGNTAPIQAQIDQLVGAMDDKIRPGDRITLIYDPASGTQVLRDGKRLTTIEGMPFKQALFGIWLSETPVQASLKKALLGN